GGRHEFRRAVRERQRRVGVFRALLERLRAAGAAVSPLRAPHRARALDEPLLASLPVLPASAVAVGGPQTWECMPAGSLSGPFQLRHTLPLPNLLSESSRALACLACLACRTYRV